ncbi:MAG: RNA 3'-terminal phosphate cyclase [Pyrinomonadaceae bacterium]|nr:RNA 3'-terminal phosphate cyclase [Phycisphaerales bacterium]
MIHIDGSQGEGGGQILRSALALSMALGRPFTITNIRANRDKPGLMRQHVTAVQAAQALCSARVDGGAAGSRQLVFEPGTVRGGTHHFAIGTAGSTTLVLQAILPALLFAQEPSDIIIEGGTHARWAPPFEFLQLAMIPLLNRLGPTVSVSLERHGFYPAGGGRIRVKVDPAASPSSFNLDTRGEIKARHASVLHARLPVEIADRQLKRIKSRLGWEVDRASIAVPEGALSPGNVVTLQIVSEHVTEVFCAIGEHGKRAEEVADEAIDQVREYLADGVSVGCHFADQLMVPLAIASTKGGGSCSFRTLPLSRHALTNVEIVNTFLNAPSRICTEGPGVRWSVGG